jgi:methylated-DNA-[protein]-cysteine S-methyltransferase
MPSIMTVESPVGPLSITVAEGALRSLHLDGASEAERGSRDDSAVLSSVVAQLDAYFEGTLHAFDVPLGGDGTAFQRAVWDALTRIPYGTVASYGEVARRVGKPSAARAVGAANHNNPIAIIVPCHRVVGANGSLTGYAGGVWRKEWLLKHEGFVIGCAPTRSASPPA